MDNHGKNLLYLMSNFPPCGGTGTLRMTKQIKYMDKLGWDCYVITPQGLQSSYPDNNLLKEVQSHAKIYRFENNSGPLGTFRSYYKLIKNVHEDRNFEWIITTSPDDRNHVYGLIFSRLFGSKWHCDVRDPLRTNWISYPKKYLPAFSDLCTTLDVRPVGRNYVKGSQLILNGFDPDDYERVGRTEGTRDREKTSFLYMGSSYKPVHNPLPLLESFGEALRRKGISRETVKLKFLGAFMEDDLKKGAMNLIEDYNLKNVVELKGFRSHKEAIKDLQESDVAIINSNDSRIPYKFAEYIGARKPVLCYIPEQSHLHDFVSDEPAIRSVEYGDTESLRSTFIAFIEKTPKGVEMSSEIYKKFNLECITEKLNYLYHGSGSTSYE